MPPSILSFQHAKSKNQFDLNVICQGLGMLPVPSTALVLFIVVAAVVPQ